MPRLPPSLFFSAAKESKLLPYLLPACRTLESARQELKWIQSELPRDEWTKACLKRARFYPLQYILGNQPFGDLDIGCAKNVLIPRWETEEWTIQLSDTLKRSRVMDLTILDSCSGTGCIPLLLKYRMPHSVVNGFDLSPHAVRLAQKNKNNTNLEVSFTRGDLFSKKTLFELPESQFDLITSNPPYVLGSDYGSSNTERSVRLYEPKLALIGDTEFYEALIANFVLPAKAKGFMFEVGYQHQIDYTRDSVAKYDSNWEVGTYYDSNGKPRCAVGWLKGSTLQCLSSLCNNIT